MCELSGRTTKINATPKNGHLVAGQCRSRCARKQPCVVGNEQTRHVTDHREAAGVGADPVGQPLAPGRYRIGDVGGAKTATKICA